MSTTLTKVLVANRGEIAVRIIRACRELDLASVAVYSEADHDALHVRLADEAVCIGPPSPLESYLVIEKLLSAARETGADGLHPGYGFLSENAALAEACAEAGIVFVGPSVEAIRVMGDKVLSRARMAEAGVPLAPGTDGSDDVDEVLARAAEIPLPVMVKAAGGGGGKGMRVVHDAAKLRDAIVAASREAHAAFGNATVYVESFVANPRHIEFQILADGAGHVVHLFERECSIQRRHQKLVEESPSVALDPELRERMGRAAVQVARAVDYTSTGTVEFLFDGGDFYFLEMNTRIQVEHPVTELVTGIDLVAWQLRIARGERLSFQQEDLVQQGHAIECRLYAEDAAKGFMPSSGRVRRLELPSGPGVRVDAGIYEGCEVTTHYDPILAKVITWGEDRDAARRRMVDALEETSILGIQTSIPYLRDVLEHPKFVSGETTTGFLDTYFADWAPPGGELVPDEVLLAAALALSRPAPAAGSRSEAEPPTPWQTLGGWRQGGG
jgi:acetyl-CoA carboxylase biotin carboxylase subunit